MTHMQAPLGYRITLIYIATVVTLIFIAELVRMVHK
jgi:hypothetical protein